MLEVLSTLRLRGLLGAADEGSYASTLGVCYTSFTVILSLSGDRVFPAVL